MTREIWLTFNVRRGGNTERQLVNLAHVSRIIPRDSGAAAFLVIPAETPHSIVEVTETFSEVSERIDAAQRDLAKGQLS